VSGIELSHFTCDNIFKCWKQQCCCGLFIVLLYWEKCRVLLFGRDFRVHVNYYGSTFQIYAETNKMGLLFIASPRRGASVL